MAFVPRAKRIKSYRLDNIVSVKIGETCENFSELRERLNNMLPHMWGVSTQGSSGQRMEHVDFTVRYDAEEYYIHKRLEREKRCGSVEKINEYESKFSADVFDAGEMIPWIRTFISRIIEINFSNKALEKQFWDDMEAMYKIYGMEGSEEK